MTDRSVNRWKFESFGVREFSVYPRRQSTPRWRFQHASKEQHAQGGGRPCRGDRRRGPQRERRRVRRAQREALLLGARASRPRARADSASNNIIYHGGSAGAGAIGVEKKPAVYLIYWGTEWADGFTTADTDGKLYSSKTLQNYLNTFMANLGGSPWAGRPDAVLPQRPRRHRRAAPAPGADYITNPKQQLKGVWTDPTPVPDDIVTLGLAENLVDDPLAAEASALGALRLRPGGDVHHHDAAAARSRPASPSTAGTTRRRRASTGSATRTGVEYAFIPWQNTDWPGARHRVRACTT